MWIVVWDPEGTYWAGALVDEARHHALTARGVVMLPVVPALFRLSGVGGFATRSWGSGWPLALGVPELTCPITAFFTKDMRALHWRARLVPTEVVPPQFTGHLHLSTDASQPGTVFAGFSSAEGPVNLRELGPKDAHGGWTVGGTGVVSAPGDAYCGFSLYGYGPGLKVLWLAISQAES